MSQKKGIIFLLHPNDYNETSIKEMTIINQIDVFILLKQYFPNTHNISSEQILHNLSSYIKTIYSNQAKINLTFDEIMNLKKHNVDLFIVSKEYLPKNILEINNNSSCTKLVETQGKQILIFRDDYRFIELKLNNEQNNSSIISINSQIKIIIIENSLILLIMLKSTQKIILIKPIRLIIMI